MPSRNVFCGPSPTTSARNEPGSRARSASPRIQKLFGRTRRPTLTIVGGDPSRRARSIARTSTALGITTALPFSHGAFEYSACDTQIVQASGASARSSTR
jgi:hypothetical protein